MLNKPTITPVDSGYKDLKLLEETLKRCNVCKVGRITGFNQQNCTCSVQILSKKFVYNGFRDYPLLVDVPLIIDATINSSLTHGDPTGSNCIVIFNDTELDKWWITGESYEPSSDRKHNLSDGFVIMRPISKAAGFVYDLLNTVLKRGNNQLILGDSSVSLKADTTQINLDTKVQIQNATQSLATIMQTFLTACEGIMVNESAPVALTSASRQAFTNVKTQLTELLK